MSTIAELLIKLGMDDGGLDKGMSSSQSKLNSWGKSLGELGQKMTTKVTLPIVAAGAAAIKWASDADEAANKVDVVFGKSAGTVKEWAASTSGSLLLSTADANEAAGTFGNLFTSMGMGQEESAQLSMDLVELGQDLSSFNNIPTDQALVALRAALVGEYEPMRALGVQLSQATVEQKALEMGIWDGNGALTAQQRVLATNALIMEQTTNAQGDAARTAKGFANQMRILRANIEDAGAKLGKIMLPYAQRLVEVLTDLVDWLSELDPKWQKVILAVAAFAAAIGPVLILLGAMASGLSALMVVFGFLLSPIGLVIVAIAALIGLGIYAWAKDLWGVRDAVDAVVEKLVAFAGALDTLGKYLRAVWTDGDTWNDWITHFPEALQPAIEGLGRFVDALHTFVDALGPVAGDIGDILQAIGEGDWAEVLDETKDALLRFGAALADLGSVSVGLLAEGLRALAEDAGLAGPTLERLAESAEFAASALEHLSNAFNAFFGGDYSFGIKEIAFALADLAASSVLTQMAVVDAFIAMGEAMVRGLVDTWNNQVRPWLQGAGVELLTAASNWALGMIQKGADLVTQWLNGVVTAWPMVLLIFNIAKQDVLNAFTQMATDAKTKAGELAEGVSQNFTRLRLLILSTVGLIATDVGTYFESAKSKATSIASSLATAVNETFRNLSNDVNAKFGGIRDLIGNRLEEASTIAVAKVFFMSAKIISTVVSMGSSLATEGFNAGAALASGIGAGIASLYDWAVGQAQSLADAVVQAVKDRIKPGSPSKVTTYYGQMLAAGLAVGMDSMEERVLAASDRMTAAALQPVGGLSVAGSAAFDGSGAGTGNTYVSISLKSQELIDLIRNAEDGGEFSRNFGAQMGLYAGVP